MSADPSAAPAAPVAGPASSAPPGLIAARLLALAVDVAGGWTALFVVQLGLIRRLGRPLALQETLLSVAGVGAAFALYQAVFVGAFGATPPKALLGLRVERLDGAPPGFARALARTLGYLASSFLWLGFLDAVRRSDGRSWHDRLAGTRVVDSRPRSELELMMLSAFGLGPIVALFVLWIWYAGGSSAYAEMHEYLAARKAMAALARMEDAHYRAFGRYADNIADLAYMSGDVDGFIDRLDQAIDLDHDLEMQAGPGGFVIKARARDGRRSPLSVYGRPPGR